METIVEEIKKDNMFSNNHLNEETIGIIKNIFFSASSDIEGLIQIFIYGLDYNRNAKKELLK